MLLEQPKRREEKAALPSDFEPLPYSVLIGRGKQAAEAIGTRRLKVIASRFLAEYANASSRIEKSVIVSKIIDIVQDACPVGAFIKFEESHWWEVSDSIARERVGSLLRDLLHDNYKSSSKAKLARRKKRKEEQSTNPTQSSQGLQKESLRKNSTMQQDQRTKTINANLTKEAEQGGGAAMVLTAAITGADAVSIQPSSYSKGMSIGALSDEARTRYFEKSLLALSEENAPTRVACGEKISMLQQQIELQQLRMPRPFRSSSDPRSYVPREHVHSSPLGDNGKFSLYPPAVPMLPSEPLKLSTSDTTTTTPTDFSRAQLAQGKASATTSIFPNDSREELSLHETGPHEWYFL